MSSQTPVIARSLSPIFTQLPVVINAGTFRRANELGVAADYPPFQRSGCTRDLMSRPEFTLVGEPRMIRLYSATTAEILGRSDGRSGRVRDIFEALEDMGAVKLPPETGPQYRIQYPDQPRGGLRLVYMEPIMDSAGRPRVFGIACDAKGRLWLRGYYAAPDLLYYSCVRWIFGRKSPTHS
ncbi:MAG TPA: hypothetical protein VJK08_02380 [Patescibacteria group bacterium]|nr:hypothetical protein [Patescibacteria group bacterium]